MPVANQKRHLQFRVELYNAFNADQWTGVNTNATFDYNTGTLTNETSSAA